MSSRASIVWWAARELVALAAALVAAGPALAAPPILRDPFCDGSGAGPELAAIPGGAFTMGTPPGTPGARPLEVPHLVELTPFSMARREVTVAEYARFLDEAGERDDDGTPYLTEARGLKRRGGQLRPVRGADDLPIVSVSWRGALAYARWLSAKTGRDYRLPTEAQWERAARGGGARGAGNCRGPEGQLAAVPAALPNAYGVHDLLGNAWEWTLDCFAVDFYFYSPTRDPVVLDPRCAAPGIRGGSFQDTAEMCRPGYRVNFWWRGAPSIGFRVVRVEPAGSPPSR
jgi:formylglycine-generating enzyme required for sulfatase activity